MFGLSVSEEGLSRKRTSVMSNDLDILNVLEKIGTCVGGHHHAILEGNNRTPRAQVYSPRFVKAIVRGLRQSVRSRDSSDCFYDDSSSFRLFCPFLSLVLDDDDDENEEDHIEDDGDVEPSADSPEHMDDSERALDDLRSLTPPEKNMIHRTHVNLGHPTKEAFFVFFGSGMQDLK